MPVLYTLMARITDWQVMRELHQQSILTCMREADARHYRVYRGLCDASLMLIVAEMPEHEAAEDVARAILGSLDAQVAGLAVHDGVWEATGFEGID